MIAPFAALMLLHGSGSDLESLPPPPPTAAERALWHYDSCLRDEMEAELDSAPLSPSRARAVVARAAAACRSAKADARLKMLEKTFENQERGPVPGPEFYESYLVNQLRKPKVADAPN